jgi:hypothetical protein
VAAAQLPLSDHLKAGSLQMVHRNASLGSYSAVAETSEDTARHAATLGTIAHISWWCFPAPL